MTELLSCQNPPAVPDSPSFAANDLNQDLGSVAVGGPADSEKIQDENRTEQKSDVHNESSTADGMFVVDWDGPDDTMNPLNWSLERKWVNMGLISAITLLTYVEDPKLFLIKVEKLTMIFVPL
jgi:hypothetical protein